MKEPGSKRQRTEQQISFDHEGRTRVILNLPVSTSNDEKAFWDIVEYLKGQRDKPFGIGGFTYSEPLPGVFWGFWWNDESKKWFKDRIVVLIVDFLAPAQTEKWSISEEISKLKKIALRAYERRGNKQDEIWLVVHSIVRQA